MKITIVLGAFFPVPPLLGGAVEKVWFALGPEFVRRGHEVVQISRDDKEFGAGGEAPNALGPPAVAAAFFDATGIVARRIPLTPAYVKSLLA